MTLPFITHTIDVKRLVEVDYTTTLSTVHTGISTNIQPLSDTNLLFDIEIKQFLCLLFTNDENLIEENDVIYDWIKEYSVENVSYYNGPEVNSMELVLTLKQ